MINIKTQENTTEQSTESERERELREVKQIR